MYSKGELLGLRRPDFSAKSKGYLEGKNWKCICAITKDDRHKDSTFYFYEDKETREALQQLTDNYKNKKDGSKLCPTDFCIFQKPAFKSQVLNMNDVLIQGKCCTCKDNCVASCGCRTNNRQCSRCPNTEKCENRQMVKLELPATFVAWGGTKLATYAAEFVEKGNFVAPYFGIIQPDDGKVTTESSVTIMNSSKSNIFNPNINLPGQGFILNGDPHGGVGRFINDAVIETDANVQFEFFCLPANYVICMAIAIKDIGENEVILVKFPDSYYEGDPPIFPIPFREKNSLFRSDIPFLTGGGLLKPICFYGESKKITSKPQEFYTQKILPDTMEEYNIEKMNDLTILNFYGVEMYGGDVSNLEDNKYFNDNNMEFGRLLIQEYIMTPLMKNRAVILSSFFMSSILKMDFNKSIPPPPPGLQKINIFQKEYIVFAVNDLPRIHWFVMTINIKGRCIIIMDSCRGDWTAINYKNFTSSIYEMLKSEWKRHYGQNNEDFNDKDFPIIMANVQQQIDDYNCGPFCYHFQKSIFESEDNLELLNNSDEIKVKTDSNSPHIWNNLIPMVVRREFYDCMEYAITKFNLPALDAFKKNMKRPSPQK